MPLPYLSIHLHEVAAERVDEYCWWPGNTAIELYQTWSLSELDALGPAGAGVETSRWSRLGFSTRGGLRGYQRFRSGDRETVLDPSLSLALPSLHEGHERLLAFEVHHWEQNDGAATERVKLLSSNESLRRLAVAWRAARADAEQARLSLDVWLDEHADELLALAIGSVAPAAAGVTAGFDLVPLLEVLFRMALDRADRHLASHRLHIGLRRTEDGYAVRAHALGLPPSPWRSSAEPIPLSLPLVDDDGGNRLTCEYRVQLVG